MILSKNSRPEVLDQWHDFVDNFHMPSKDFYGRVEQELKRREIPGLCISRIEWEEGGVLSANREYLRLTREKWVFDICAAPFGTGYFFSYRFTEIPIKINPLGLLGVVLLFPFLCSALLMFAIKALGFFLGPILLLVLFCFGIWFLRNVVALGLADLDSKLLQMPVLGGLYDRYLRKDSYYRQDTRFMYLATVPAVVKMVADEVKAAKGIRRPDGIEGKPILKELAGAA